MFSLLSFLLIPAAAQAFSYTDPSKSYLGMFADLILVQASATPEELNDPALSAVTREFGPSVIPMAALPFHSEMAQADTKPWSSWWFPRLDKDLFEAQGDDAALVKYDMLRATSTGAKSSAADYERSKWSPDAPRWEGLCDAWAIASLLFKEPTRPRTLRLDGGFNNYDAKRITFSVSDQKALLLKSVDAIDTSNLKIYGQKFTGDYKNWIYPDIFPQELHRYVEKQLFEKRKPFVMDHDPGVEVWNEPVYKANYTISPVAGRDDAVFVRLYLYSAAPLRKDDKNRVGTKELSREYNYYLYGKRNSEGNLVVESGVWAKGDTVDSRRDHPDYVFSIENPSQVVRKSFNPEIDPAIVDQIVPGAIR